MRVGLLPKVFLQRARARLEDGETGERGRGLSGTESGRGSRGTR
jgi:hypothetical protein